MISSNWASSQQVQGCGDKAGSNIAPFLTFTAASIMHEKLCLFSASFTLQSFFLRRSHLVQLYALQVSICLQGPHHSIKLSCVLSSGTDISPIVPALEKIWRDSKGQSLADFNFRTVTSKFNELVYQYPIRIPERYSLVIRSLLTQVSWEGCGPCVSLPK